MESKLSLLTLLSSLHFDYTENKKRVRHIRMDAQETREYYRFFSIVPQSWLVFTNSLGNVGMYPSPTQRLQ